MSVPETGLSKKKITAMATDEEVVAILAEMSDSQLQPNSAIKSPKQQRDDSDTAPKPPSKCPKTTDGFKELRNKLSNPETRRAKYKRSFMVLKEHATCPHSLQ